ncbi:MAG: hypothetical protein MSC30_06955 [Gaiellaceae bacterium MAG52_C11]|nr:hypothetical protein [Candidatus Gaiellasilicea maunaloa]
MNDDRIGRGPWARLLASAIVGDEGSSRAEHGRRLVRARSVDSLRVATGELSAVVDEHAVTIGAEPLPPRIWAAISRYARGSRPLEAAVAGREQSVQLEHLLTVDWDAPLVPRREAIVRSCTCARFTGGDGTCEHVAALAFAIAEELDRDPSVLLHWRGCTDEPPPAVEPEPAPAVERPAGGDIWRGGALPEPRARRPLPLGAVLKRLGPSGIRVGGNDLADVLVRAYASFHGLEPGTCSDQTGPGL